MKGYFSKLAEQSGLRYAKGNIASSARNAKRKNEEIEPLDREEIVLLPLAGAENETPETVKKHSPTESFALPEESFAPRKDDLPKDDSAEKIPVVFSERESLKASLPPEEKSDLKNREIVSEIKNQPENFAGDKLSEPEIQDSTKTRIAEQIVFKEKEPAKDIEAGFVEAQSAQNLQPAEISGIQNNETIVETPEKSSVEMISETPSQPEYFKKTAEILETGKADKLEVQQILLQEISQWVSAAPALTEAENISVTENIFETKKEIQAILPPNEKNTLVRHEPAENLTAQSSDNLQEQNFNLSIGTITVVIEEPENQPKVAAENQSRVVETTKPEKREFSRLSRYYL
jgi:hypothetical protein